jgi:hypothetical protein
MGESGLNSYGPKQGQVTGYYGHGNGAAGSV